MTNACNFTWLDSIKCGKKTSVQFYIRPKKFIFKYVSNFLLYPLMSNKTIVQFYIVNLQPTKSKHVCVILHYNLHPTKSKHVCVILHYNLHPTKSKKTTCVQFYLVMYCDVLHWYVTVNKFEKSPLALIRENGLAFKGQSYVLIEWVNSTAIRAWPLTFIL